MKNIMLDLETLGTTPGCAILSVGAVEFGPEGLGREFYYVVGDLQGSVDFSTVRWWLGQSEEARRSVLDTSKMASWRNIVDMFSKWFEESNAEFLWCHGATFDEPIFRAAALSAGANVSWKFWNVRCTRTLYALSGISPKRAAGYHNALTDARAQAEAACASMAILGWPS